MALAASTAMSEAASVRASKTSEPAIDLSAFLTPKQFEEDGSVYGVRMRATSSDLPTLQIMPNAKRHSAGLTSDPCPEIGSGACFTPHPLNVTRFGMDIQGATNGTLFVVPGSAQVLAPSLAKSAVPTLTTNPLGSLGVTNALVLPGPDLSANAPIKFGASLSPTLLPVQVSAHALPTSYLATGGLIPTTQANVRSGPQALGAINAMASYASGPLASAISRSSVLKNAVLIDSTGQNFQVDLTRAADLRGLDSSSALMAAQFTDVIPFAFGVESPVGPLFASGYATDTVSPQAVSGMYRGPADYHSYDLRDFSLGVTVAPGIDINVGYHLDMGGAFNRYDASSSLAYDGLFLSASAVNSPYAALASGGSFVGTTVALADDLHLRLGQVSLSGERQPFSINPYSLIDRASGPRALYDLRSARGTMAGLSWDFARWGGLGVTATRINEQNGLLGGYGSGALAVANSASTTALGVSARIGFGDGWVTTASYNEGLTRLDLKPSSLFASASGLNSRSYGVAIAKHGLFGEDSIGFAVTRPIQIYSGSAEIAAADGVDANGDLALNRERISLAGVKSETDIELGYVTTFLDGALALQANAAYQLNTQGQSGSNSLSVVSRAKIKF